MIHVCDDDAWTQRPGGKGHMLSDGTRRGRELRSQIGRKEKREVSSDAERNGTMIQKALFLLGLEHTLSESTRDG